MSAKKGFQTKLFDDENTDSGFLSGPIDKLPGDEEESEEVSDSGCVKSDVVSEEKRYDVDSGLCLSERLESLSVEDQTETAAKARAPDADIPPLAFLFQQDDDGDTQLHIASVHGCQKSVSTLIRVCPDTYWLNLPNDYGHTALHLAVMSGHAIVARMLVQAGTSLELRDVVRGDTPIHTATRAKNVECLQALLAPIGSGRSQKNLASILNFKNYEGQTCVHLAATMGHVQMLQTLVYYGADVNVREGLAGWTALHIAARRGDVKLAQHLLERCSGVQGRARDYAGRTPRRLALRHPAFATKEGARLFKPTADDSDTDSDDDDEGDIPTKRSRVDRSKNTKTSPLLETASERGSAEGRRKPPRAQDAT